MPGKAWCMCSSLRLPRFILNVHGGFPSAQGTAAQSFLFPRVLHKALLRYILSCPEPLNVSSDCPPKANMAHAGDPRADAAALRKAMKGLGTDDKTLIDIVTTKTNEQLQVLRQVYQHEIQRDLVEDIKGETSGNYEDALVGTVLSRAEWDAKCLRKCMKGIGTDERTMIQILAHRDGQEVEAIKNAYLQMYGKTLAHDIEGDTSGLTRKFFLAMINSPRPATEQVDPHEVQRDVNTLYNAGQGRWGTNEDQFISIICKHGNMYLKALNLAYGRACGDTLVRAVQKEMSGWLAEGLEAMIQDHDAFYAKLLFKAMDGAGTDEATLVRVLTSRRHRLFWINDRFMELCHKELRHRVEGEVSGNLKRVLLGITNNC